VTAVTILPGCDAASLDDRRLTFRDSILVSSIRVELYNQESCIWRFDFRRWDHYAVSKGRAGADHSVTQHHIQDERWPQLHRFERLNKRASARITQKCAVADLSSPWRRAVLLQ